MTNALKNTLEKIRLPELVAEKVVSCGKLKRLILKGGDYLVHSCKSVWDTGKDFEITLDDAHKTKIHLHHGSHKKIATDLPCCFANTITNPTLEVSRWRAYKPEAIFSFDDSITNSWIDSLSVRGERDGAPGFRQAQVGAIHSVLAHWSTSCEASTIVLPTGTGKTETMLGLSLSEAAGLTVVIVPTKDLRNQIAKKFEELGILHSIGVLSPRAKFPCVGILKGGLNSLSDLSEFSGANVIITTPSLILKDPQVIEALKEKISHLYFDEAHHLGAASWKALKQTYAASKIVQFTATPYRRDRLPIEGKVLFQYSLHDALKAGSFSEISLITVEERNPSKKDLSIAQAAIEQLNSDHASGYGNHRMMVRTKNKERAEILGELYRGLHTQEKVVVIYSGVAEESRLIENVKQGLYDVIICVDMLKEGFDYPEFKIAAVHDLHKSLGVTMQFIGRFARNRPDLGMAHIVVNFAEEEIPEELERLYAEGSGWEKVIAEVAQAKQDEAVGFLNFLKQCEPFRAFDDPNQTISPRMVNPALSCVVFKADREPVWGNFQQAFSSQYKFSQPYHNESENLFYFATQVRASVKWTKSEAIRDQVWNLVVLYYSENQGLLYVGYSDKNFKASTLVKKITGKEMQMQGSVVFRSFQNIKRLKVIHAGLLKPANRNHRYSKFSGSDVTKQLEAISNGAPTKKSDFVGTGFRDGFPVSIGASQKGKIWNPSRRDNTKVWMEWCQEMGELLLDDSITDDQLFRDTVKTSDIAHFDDDFIVVAMDWNSANFERYAKLVMKRKGKRIPFHECELQNWEMGQSHLDFEIYSEVGGSIKVRLKLGSENGFEFQILSEGSCSVEGSRTRSDESLAEFLNGYPPTIFLADGSQIEGCQRHTFPYIESDLPENFFERWDWGEIDLKTESIYKKERDQWVERTNSIQQHVQERKRNEGATLVYNDDGAGESADVVAIFEEETKIRIQLLHCKYSKAATSGHRVGDLYEVCGQAVKSVKWRWNPRELLKHLSQRKSSEMGSGRRFFHGDAQDLSRMQGALDYKEPVFEFFIVQPGLNAQNVPDDLRKIIASCNSAINDMTECSLRFISS